MNRTQRILLAAGVTVAAVAAFLGIASTAQADDSPGRAPVPDGNGGGGDGGGVLPVQPSDPGTSPVEPPPLVPPGTGPVEPPLPDPVGPEVPSGPGSTATWIGRHEKLRQAGYWQGASIPSAPDGRTVQAIQQFQIQTEKARNSLQGVSSGALNLSQQYGVIVPDGKWGPQTSAWLDWALKNKGLHSQAVFSNTGKAAGYTP